MKRFFAVLLSFVLALSLLTGCTKTTEEPSSNASGSRVQNPYKDKDTSSKEDSGSSSEASSQQSSQQSSQHSSQESHESSSKPEKEPNSSEDPFSGTSSQESSESSGTSSESSSESSEESSESSSEASSESSTPEDSSDSSTETIEIPPLVDFVGVLSGGEVVVPGFSHIKDMYGKDAIRVYYEYTNHHAEPVQVSYYLNVDAFQGDETLSYTWCESYEGVPESGNEWLWVYPGHTVRCFKEFNYDPDSDEPVLVEFYDGSSAFVYLPLHVDEEMDYLWTPFPAFMPEFTDGLKSGGYLTDGSFISCDNVYYLYPIDGSSMRAAEFNLTFENNGEYEISPGQLVYITAYQDGVQLFELEFGAPFYYTDLLYKSIEPGESMTFQVYFLLRTDDPVEILVTEHYPNECVYGVMFSTFEYY